MAANLVFKNGFFQTNSRSFKSDELQGALVDFIKNEMPYKSNFLQSKYGYGFDGYSFMGQTDSSNQYATDMLHSFVLSDFQDAKNFPKEFHSFFNENWKSLQLKIRRLETEVIELLDIPDLHEFYNENIGHMISCNFYPEIKRSPLNTTTRLSAHTDVSLFTIFPFGFDSDFYFEDGVGNWVNIPATDDIIIFPGYLLEVFTNGKIKALNHKVDLPKSISIERYSFAYFSLPYPKKQFVMNGKEWSSEAYFKAYLELF
jgi:isopenicillin N synthase-like dioxygenase